MAVVTEEAARPEGDLVGLVEIPPSLNRLNWGALMLPFLWALAHGLWSWVGVFVAVRVLNFGIGGLMRRFEVEATVPNVVVWVVMALAAWAIGLMFALRANRLHWQREAARVERQSQDSIPRWPQSVDSFSKSQGQWAALGVAVYVLSTLLSAYGAFDGSSRFSWMPAALVATTIVELVFLGAVFVWDWRGRKGAS